MNATDTGKNANELPAARTPAQNSASQRRSTTQDQINEMESEGQATKAGQGSTPPPLSESTAVRGQKHDAQKGAVEGDHRSDTEPGNKNAVGALDKNGLPKNKKAIAEDSIGARADETQG
jgi:hypothetical protein